MADDILAVEARLTDFISKNMDNIVSNVRNSADQIMRKNEEQISSNNLLGKSANELAASWDVAKIAVSGLVSAMGAMEIFNVVKDFIKETAIVGVEYNKMQAQMKASLGFTSAALSEESEALAKEFNMKESTITQVQHLLSEYTKNEDQIKRLTPAVLNLASALGVDFNTAALQVAKSISSSNDTIGRYKVHIDGAADSSERIESIITALNTKFEGQAKAVGETEGWWTKLANAVHNYQEELAKINAGKIILLSDKEKQETISLLNYQVKHRTEVGESIYQKALKDLAQYDADVKAKNDALNAQFQNDFDKDNKDKLDKAAKLQEELNKLSQEGQIRNLKADEALRIKNGEDAVMIHKIYAVQIDKINEELAAAQKKRIDEIAARENKIGPNRATFDAEQVKNAEIEKTKSAQKLEAEKSLAESAASLKAVKNPKATVDENFEIQIAAIKSQGKAKQDALDAEEAIRLSKIKGDKVLEDLLNKEFDNKKKALAINTANEIAAAQKIQHDKDIAAQKQALATTVSNLSGLAAKHKEFVVAYKAMAIAQATIDTFKSAEAVYAGFSTIPIIGQGLGIAGAAVAIAAGLANVQQIANQKFALGGTSTGGMAQMNEWGPETAILPAGTQVLSHNETTHTTNAGITYNLVLPSNQFVDHSAVESLKQQLPSILENLADNLKLEPFKAKIGI